jgi:hypothetical protein
LDRTKERLAAGLRLIRPVEFREHEEHFDELALPLLLRGELFTREAWLTDVLEDLIPEDDLLRPPEEP